MEYPVVLRSGRGQRHTGNKQHFQVGRRRILDVNHLNGFLPAATKLSH